MYNLIWVNYKGFNACTDARGVPSLGSESNDRTEPRIESRDLRGCKSLISAQFFCCCDFWILQSSVTARNVPRTPELIAFVFFGHCE